MSWFMHYRGGAFTYEQRVNVTNKTGFLFPVMLQRWITFSGHQVKARCKEYFSL